MNNQVLDELNKQAKRVTISCLQDEDSDQAHLIKMDYIEWHLNLY